MTQPAKRSWIYKRVGDLVLEADVYSPAALDGESIVVWIHGGALIFGHREFVPPWLLEVSRRSGFALVSIDYRLAPESKLPEIVTDVEDAFGWLRGHGPEPPPGDAGPIAVVGESAGGYLALVTGFRVRPRPAAIVSLWGYGDLIGDWYSRPSPHPAHHQIVMSKEEALRQVSGPPVADDRRRAGDGYAFYQYCRQHGLWPKEVTGWDPDRESDRFIPFMPVEHVTPDYPPTLLVHGVEDTDVPHDRSLMMAAAMREQGVEHRLISVEGAEHGLDGVDERTIDDALDQAGTFLVEHLRWVGPDRTYSDPRGS
jgi:acetyl esterase/lipase